MTKWSDLYGPASMNLGQLAFLNTVDAAHMAPGAAVGNIGYTPANKAGDTFSGNVAVPNLWWGPASCAAITADAQYTNVILNTVSNNGLIQYDRTNNLFYLYQGGQLNLSINAAGTLTARTMVSAPTLSVGDGSMYFQTDSSQSYLYLNGNACYLAYVKSSGLLKYIVNSIQIFSVNLNGDITGNTLKCHGVDAQGGTIYCGSLRPADVVATGPITCPDFYASGSDQRLRITGNGGASYVFFDTAGGNQSYMIWDYNAQYFNYVSGGANRFGIALNGQATFSNGLQVNGTFGCGAQGFFSGNLTAAVNNGIAANCVVVGYFASGTYYNVNQAGMNVNGTTGLFVYAGSTINTFWSTSASDRRLKENIKRPSLDPLDVVRKLPIWSCDYIAPRPKDADLERPEIWPQFREHWPFSFMADEVDAAMPNATIKDDDGRPVALHPQHLIATLWAAMQQLTDRLESAEAKLAAFPGVAP